MGLARTWEAKKMRASVPITAETQAARLELRIKKHKEEVARLREQIGDPQEALAKFVRDRFEYQALAPNGGHTGGANAFTWEEDDDSDAW